jgi:phosphate uptake regulator
MPDHIVKAYDQDISSLKTMLAQMGGFAEEQLDNAITARCGAGRSSDHA